MTLSAGLGSGFKLQIEPTTVQNPIECSDSEEIQNCYFTLWFLMKDEFSLPTGAAKTVFLNYFNTLTSNVQLSNFHEI